MANVHEVPNTKLLGSPEEGYVIVLECECGDAVEYPGHPDERTEVRCENCETIFRSVSLGQHH